MKKKGSTAIPDFSRKRPAKDGRPVVSADKPRVPNTRQPQKSPAQTKNGGRRGS